MEKSSSKMIKIIKAILALRTTNFIFIIILFLINFLWFYKVADYNTIMGDDLSNWFNYDNNSFLDSTIFNHTGDKYRPIFSFFFYLLFKLFSYHYPLFIYFNILFNFIIIVVFYNLIKKVSYNNQLIAFSVAIIYIISRFAYYNILQITGFLMSLSLLLFILIISYSIDYLKNGSLKYLVYILILNSVIVFTYEAYIVLIPGLFLMIYYKTSHYTRIKRILVSSLVLVPFIMNFFLKIFIFHSNALEGTAGQAITFNIPMIITFLGAGILNLLWINAGPAYLNGISFLSVSATTNIYIGIAIIVILTIFVAYFRSMKKTKVLNNHIKIFLLFIMILSSLLLAASITIRQELRWLYAPFVVSLVYLSYAFSNIIVLKNSNKILKYILLFSFCLIVWNLDTYYKSHLSNVYFASSQKIADSLYEQTLGKYGKNITNYNVFLKKDENLQWPILSSDFIFFAPYFEDQKFKVNFFDSYDNLLKEDFINDEKDTIILELNNSTNQIENISDQIQYFSTKNEISYNYNFVGEFSKGSIEPKNHKADTPTGLGVLLMDWNIGSIKKQTITIISGFEITYNDIQINKDEKIKLSVGMPYPTGDGANVVIYVVENNIKTKIYETDLKPENREWKDVSIPLTDYEGQIVNITFSTISPSGDQTSDWIALADVGIQ